MIVGLLCGSNVEKTSVELREDGNMAIYNQYVLSRLTWEGDDGEEEEPPL